MPKFIRTGTEKTGAWFRLTGDPDLDELRIEIRSAHEDGRPFEVAVEMQDDPRTKGSLMLNPSVPAFLLVEVPEGGTLDDLGYGVTG